MWSPLRTRDLIVISVVICVTSSIPVSTRCVGRPDDSKSFSNTSGLILTCQDQCRRKADEPCTNGPGPTCQCLPNYVHNMETNPPTCVLPSECPACTRNGIFRNASETWLGANCQFIFTCVGGDNNVVTSQEWGCIHGTCTEKSLGVGQCHCDFGIDAQTGRCQAGCTCTDFQPTGVCSLTCGGGVTFSTRTCTGVKCDSFATKSNASDCNTQACCSCGSYEKVGTCSKTCGSGIQEFRRTCTACPTDTRTEKTEPCNTQACGWCSTFGQGDSTATYETISEDKNKTCGQIRQTWTGDCRCPGDGNPSSCTGLPPVLNKTYNLRPCSFCETCTTHRSDQTTFWHPSDCSKYRLCIAQPDKKYKVKDMPCPRGTRWDGKTMTCNHCGVSVCYNGLNFTTGQPLSTSKSKCGPVVVPTVCEDGPVEGNCAAFLKCTGTGNDRRWKCCPKNQRFSNETKKCVNIEKGDTCKNYCYTPPPPPICTLTCNVTQVLNSAACRCTDILCYQANICLLFDEVVNNNFVEEHGLSVNNEGTPNVTQVARQIIGNSAAYFDGSNHLEIPFLMNNEIGHMSVAVWFKQGASNGPTSLISNGACASAASIGITLNGTYLSAGLMAEKGGILLDCTKAYENILVPVTPTTGNILDVWHHVALTFDGHTIRMYVNGVQQTVPASAILPNTGHHVQKRNVALILGRDLCQSDAAGFIGCMDEMKFFLNKVLTPAEVLTLLV